MMPQNDVIVFHHCQYGMGDLLSDVILRRRSDDTKDTSAATLEFYHALPYTIPYHTIPYHGCALPSTQPVAKFGSFFIVFSFTMPYQLPYQTEPKIVSKERSAGADNVPCRYPLQLA